MGTRNLTMVIIDKQTKVAQYGQWDGYPEGQGIIVLEFLRKENMDKFKTQVRQQNWLTPEQEEIINKDLKWESKYPYLSRDMAAEILQYIQYENPVGLMNKESFAADSLFCEYAYVIDLDSMKLEVYEGFNKTPLTDQDRFFYLQTPESEYKPVKKITEFDINNLPTQEDFLLLCNPSEQAEG
jgi:hypothetical protein